MSEETAKKVLKIAQKYNYVPNIYARNLKSQSLNIIGVITEDLTIFHTPEIVDGINYYCEKQGYSFVLGNRGFISCIRTPTFSPTNTINGWRTKSA